MIQVIVKLGSPKCFQLLTKIEPLKLQVNAFRPKIFVFLVKSLTENVWFKKSTSDVPVHQSLNPAAVVSVFRYSGA